MENSDFSIRRRTFKGAEGDWKRYVEGYGRGFIEKFSHIINTSVGKSDGDVQTTVGGLPWTASCHLCRAVPLPSTGCSENGMVDDMGEIVILRVKDKNYRCHRSVIRESVYLDTLLSMRWIECIGVPDDQPVALQLDERMFLPALYALYGWCPTPAALDAGLAEQFEWLASCADFLSLPVMSEHLQARLRLFLIPEAEATARGVPGRLPIEALLRLLPVCRHLGVTEPLALLTDLETVPLWWRSPSCIDAMMRVGQTEICAVLAEASAKKEASFERWFDLLHRLALTIAGGLDSSARGHQRRQFLLELRPQIVLALAAHAAAVPAPALEAVSALWRGLVFARDQMGWEEAEEGWEEVATQPTLGPLLLAAQEAILAGRKVPLWSTEVTPEERDELQNEVEQRVHRALRRLLPYIMQMDVWKAKNSGMKRALLKELNFFGIEAPAPNSTRSAALRGPSVSLSNLATARTTAPASGPSNPTTARTTAAVSGPSNPTTARTTAAVSGPSNLTTASTTARASAVVSGSSANHSIAASTVVAPLSNPKFASTLSKQVLGSLRSKDSGVDVSKAELAPARKFAVSLVPNRNLEWLERKG